jgi:hypothetical protein
MAQGKRRRPRNPYRTLELTPNDKSNWRGGNTVLRGVYQTTVLAVRAGAPTDPRRASDGDKTFVAEVVVNGTRHEVEFHLFGDMPGYSSSVDLARAFPFSRDAIILLGGIAERILKGEVVEFPIERLI